MGYQEGENYSRLGFRFEVKRWFNWIDSSLPYEKSIPIDVAEYVLAHNIHEEPLIACCIPTILGKHNRAIIKMK